MKLPLTKGIMESHINQPELERGSHVTPTAAATLGSNVVITGYKKYYPLAAFIILASATFYTLEAILWIVSAIVSEGASSGIAFLTIGAQYVGLLYYPVYFLQIESTVNVFLVLVSLGIASILIILFLGIRKRRAWAYYGVLAFCVLRLTFGIWQWYRLPSAESWELVLVFLFTFLMFRNRKAFTQSP